MSVPETPPTPARVADLLTSRVGNYDDGNLWELRLSAKGNVVHIGITPDDADGNTYAERLFEAHVFAVEPAPPVAAEPVVLPASDARQAVFDGVGATFGGWTVVAIEYLSPGRWHSWHQLVIRNEAGEHLAADFEAGLTERQQVDPWEGRATVTFSPVRQSVRVERTVTWVHATKAEMAEG